MYYENKPKTGSKPGGQTDFSFGSSFGSNITAPDTGPNKIGGLEVNDLGSPQPRGRTGGLKDPYGIYADGGAMGGPDPRIAPSGRSMNIFGDQSKEDRMQGYNPHQGAPPMYTGKTPAGVGPAVGGYGTGRIAGYRDAGGMGQSMTEMYDNRRNIHQNAVAMNNGDWTKDPRSMALLHQSLGKNDAIKEQYGSWNNWSEQGQPAYEYGGKIWGGEGGPYSDIGDDWQKPRFDGTAPGNTPTDPQANNGTGVLDILNNAGANNPYAPRKDWT